MADSSRSDPGNSGGPPPPPPPPQMGAIPARRLASEISERRAEPPLCVQNAMMTKDKKPFTYTPGGIDLSQIRSPRMARRIVRNAKSEGVTDTPRPSPLAQTPTEPLPPSALAAMQPQMPIQVFPDNPPAMRKIPSNAPPPPPILMRPSRLQRQPSPTQESAPVRTTPPVTPGTPATPITPVTPGTPASPCTPGTAHTPPSPGVRAPGRAAPPDRDVGSLVIPLVQQMPKLQSPPIPWMHQGSRNSQQEVAPPWVNREPQDSDEMAQVKPSSTRVVPMQVQGRDHVQPQARPSQANAGSPGVRIIPIQVEGAPTQRTPDVDQRVQQQPGWGNGTGPTQSRSFRVLQQTTEGYDEDKPKTRVIPIQHEHTSVPADQMRRMQLSEDDRMLMDQFKAQVSEDTSLHTTEEPRFRGAAIPSKAFRALQNMTGSESGPEQTNVQKGGLVNRQFKQVKPPSYEEPSSPQPYIPPSEQKVLEPRKYTGCSIPGRSFKMLQAITEPENYANGTLPETSEPSVYGAHQWDNYDPCWSQDPYWGYYYPNPESYAPQSVDSTGCIQDGDTDALAQYWPMAPYGYYCYYGYPPMYPSYYYSTETESCAEDDTSSAHNSSSAPRPVSDNVGNTDKGDDTSAVESESSSDDCNSDTEHDPSTVNDHSVVDEQSTNEETSVSDEPNLVEEQSATEEISVNDEHLVTEDSECESTDESTLGEENPFIVPHQLSMILEESEINDLGSQKSRVRTDSACTTISDCSTTIANTFDDTDVNEDEDDEADTASSTVTVCLPLKLKFSRTENDEDVTTITVGTSQMNHELDCESPADVSVTLECPLPKLNLSTDDVVACTVTRRIPSGNINPQLETTELSISDTDVSEDETDSSSDSESEDDLNIEEDAESFAKTNNQQQEGKAMLPLSNSGELSEDETDSSTSDSESEEDEVENVPNITKVTEPIKETAKTDAIHTSGSILESIDATAEQSNTSDDSSSSDSSSDEDDSDSDSYADANEASVHKIVASHTQSSIKSHDGTNGIELNRNTSRSSLKSMKSVTSMLEQGKGDQKLKTSRDNKIKSHEDSEEEEVDSGVTSDMSRHISETDTEYDSFPELNRKMNKYQRAATHSRLFKLLQGEGGDQTDEEPEPEPKYQEHKIDVPHVWKNDTSISVRSDSSRSVDSDAVFGKREHLSLPLSQYSSSDPDSLSCSSGLASPASPTVNERLLTELIQSLLRGKKGRTLRKLPMEKLRAAALRILQEDMDQYDTVSSSTTDSTPSGTPHDMYGNYYYDYNRYYETWGMVNPDAYNDDYDILPSRTFRGLQERAMGRNNKGIGNSWAKCPRVLSAKRLNANRDSFSPVSSSNTNDAFPSRQDVSDRAT